MKTTIVIVLLVGLGLSAGIILFVDHYDKQMQKRQECVEFFDKLADHFDHTKNSVDICKAISPIVSY